MSDKEPKEYMIPLMLKKDQVEKVAPLITFIYKYFADKEFKPEDVIAVMTSIIGYMAGRSGLSPTKIAINMLDEASDMEELMQNEGAMEKMRSQAVSADDWIETKDGSMRVTTTTLGREDLLN